MAWGDGPSVTCRLHLIAMTRHDPAEPNALAELDAILPGAKVARATAEDAGEILVLQRCCWTQEAIANGTLEIPPLHEGVDVVRRWIGTWSAWTVRLDHRLVGAARARLTGDVWEIGRLMVAPDLAGRGLGRWLLRHVEASAPPGARSFLLYTGTGSAHNLAIYERAGYARGEPAWEAPELVFLRKPRA